MEPHIVKHNFIHFGHTIRTRIITVGGYTEFQASPKDCVSILYPDNDRIQRKVAKLYKNIDGINTIRHSIGNGKITFLPLNWLGGIMDQLPDETCIDGRTKRDVLAALEAFSRRNAPAFPDDQQDDDARSGAVDTEAPVASTVVPEATTEIQWTDLRTSETRPGSFRHLSHAPYEGAFLRSIKVATDEHGGCVYALLVGYIDDWPVIKFGQTDDLSRRSQEHAQEIGPHQIIAAIPTRFAKRAEKLFSDSFVGGQRISARIPRPSGRSKLQTELYRMPAEMYKPDDIFQGLYDCVKQADSSTKTAGFGVSKRMQRSRHKETMARLDIKKGKLELKKIKLLAKLLREGKDITPLMNICKDVDGSGLMEDDLLSPSPDNGDGDGDGDGDMFSEPPQQEGEWDVSSL